MQAWEVMRLVVDAIERASCRDRDMIRDAMEKTKGFPIAIGPAGTKLSFSPYNHDLFTSADQVVIRRVTNGSYGSAINFR